MSGRNGRRQSATMRLMRSRISTLFAVIARRFPIDWNAAAPDRDRGAKEALQANFAAIVLNGLFFPTAGKILGAGLLLTWFLDELTSSALAVAALVPIQYGAALLAQPWIGQWMSRRPKRAVYYRNQALLRALVWIALGAAMALLPADAGVLLVIFFAVVIADAVAAGVGNIAFSDTLARVIPSALRGRARGGRGMAGALVAGTAGILINRLVSPESGLGVFALLFGIAGFCYGLGGLTFGTISDIPIPPMTQARRESLRVRIREMLAAPGYRRFLAVQALLIPATLGLTFFGLFGRREFNLDLKAFGLLVVSDAAAPFIGNWFWGKWADRVGNRWVLVMAAVASLIAPVIALFAAYFGQQWSAVLVLGVFGAIVFALGIAGAGVELASKNFILELAPDAARRPVYIAVNDTLVALPTMLLILGGTLIDRAGFTPLFIAIGAFSAGAALLATTLPRRAAAKLRDARLKSKS
jgi:MFS family permease